MTTITILLAFIALTVLNWSLCRAAGRGERAMQKRHRVWRFWELN